MTQPFLTLFRKNCKKKNRVLYTIDLERKPLKKSLCSRKSCFGMTRLEQIQVKVKPQVLEEAQKVTIRIEDDSGSNIGDIF